MIESNGLPVAAEKLIPHRPPMQLIEALEEFGGDTGTVGAVVEAGNPLLEEDGTLGEVALLELLAQSFAALQGYADSLTDQAPRQGFLVGVRKVTFHSRPRLGDRLKIKLETVARLEGFAVVQGQILCRGELLAEGNLKLWIMPPEGSGEK